MVADGKRNTEERRSDFPEAAPPRLASALLNTILLPELCDDVLGDLQEGFTARLSTGSRSKARRWYWRQALQSFRYARGGAGAPDPLPGRHAPRLQRIFMGFFKYDVGYALRQLRSAPGFTAVAVLSLVLGIGVNAVIFTVINGVLLKPLPVRDIDALVEVFSGTIETPYRTTSYPDYLDYRAAADAFSGIAASFTNIYNWNRETHSETLFGELVSDDYFTVLGLRPHLGRWFLPEENATPATHPVVVLSYGFWERNFGADPSIIGRTIKLNGTQFVVVGIAPREFTGMMPVLRYDLWTPLMTEPLINAFGSTGLLDERGTRMLRLHGRIAEDASFEQARTQLETIAARLAREYPGSNANRSATLVPLAGIRVHPDFDSSIAPVAGLLMALVGLVLLVACANVANMLLARASGRRREIGVRLALGASRWRLVRQFLTESVILALLGGAAALLMAFWFSSLVAGFQPPISVSVSLDVSPDARVFIFTLGASLLTGILFGLAPALRSSKPDLVATLKDDAAVGQAAGRFTLRNALVVAQVAVSLMLLVAAGLLLRSLANAHAIELGFDEENLAYASTSLSSADYDQQQGRLFLRQATERVAGLPGVVSVTYATRLPLGLTHATQGFFIEGYAPPSGERGVELEYNTVGPGYFSVLGVPIMAGREVALTDDDRAPLVAVVNEAFVAEYWPGEDPLGKRIKFDSEDDPWIEVIGVCADYKMNTVGEAAAPMVHTALLQQEAYFETIMARTAGDPAPIVVRMSEEISARDPDVSFFSSGTMAQNLTTVLLPVRLGAALLAVFGLLALGLAAVGVYGVIAYTVARRTHEIGVRMALGARSNDVLRLVVWQSMRVVLVGVALGALGAAAVASTLGAFLYDISAIDPLTFLGTIAILLGVALLANYIPARRGARIDPMVALKTE